MIQCFALLSSNRDLVLGLWSLNLLLQCKVHLRYGHILEISLFRLLGYLFRFGFDENEFLDDNVAFCNYMLSLCPYGGVVFEVL